MLLKQTGSKSLPYPVYTLPFVSETHFLFGELYIPRLLPMHGEEPEYEAICRYNSSITVPSCKCICRYYSAYRNDNLQFAVIITRQYISMVIYSYIIKLKYVTTNS